MTDKEEKMTKLHLTISKSLRARLTKAKKYPRETYADTIDRLLSKHEHPDKQDQ